METSRVDVTGGGEVLAMAAYFAVLAYPESHRKRDRAVKAVLAFMCRGARAQGLPLSPIASELFRAVPPRREFEIFGTGQKGLLPTLRRRHLAALAADRMVRTRCSLRHCAAISGLDESHFKQKIWTESKPVLHLMLALHHHTLRHWRFDRRPWWEQLLARAGWVHEAMLIAEQGRPKLTRLFRISPETQIRLLPADHADSTTAPT
jgi:hypothetical protein